MQQDKIWKKIRNFFRFRWWGLRYEIKYWLDSLGKWFMEDIAFTLLPIFVIMFIKMLTGQNLDALYLSPEWSFATIVSYGVALTNIIKLKAEIQKDDSNSVYSMTRLIVLLLVLSVIVLALVVLRSDKLVVLQEESLFVLQMSIFGLSIVTLLASYIGKEVAAKLKHDFPNNLDRRKYYEFLRSSLVTALDEIAYVRYSLRRKSGLEFSQWENTSSAYTPHPNMDEVVVLVKQLEVMVNDVKNRMEKKEIE